MMPVVGFPQSEAWSVAATTLAWVRTAPLGMPVVPPVNWIRAGSSGIEGDAGEPRLGVRRDQLGEVAPSLLQSRSLAVLTPNPVM